MDPLKLDNSHVPQTIPQVLTMLWTTVLTTTTPTKKTKTWTALGTSVTTVQTIPTLDRKMTIRMMLGMPVIIILIGEQKY